MNAAAKTSCQLIEKTLRKSPAFKKVDEGLYVVKQGSSIVMINVIAWNPDRAVVRCVAQLVNGVTMEVPLALQLLEMNALLRFGAFVRSTTMSDPATPRNSSPAVVTHGIVLP